jgi:hypothetical protein
MRRAAIVLTCLGKGSAIAALALLAGCAHQLEPQAPVVLSEPLQITCPEPVSRMPPAYLVERLHLEAPEIVARGAGDYGITRAGLEKLIDGHRAAAARIEQWRAWATPETKP